MSRAGKYLKLDPLVSVLRTLLHVWKKVLLYKLYFLAYAQVCVLKAKSIWYFQAD